MSNWQGTRDAEYTRIKTLIASGTPLLHVLGSRGSGKTTLVEEILDGSPHVFVDSKTCGSVNAVMSCVLRRLTTARTGSKKLEDSEDSEGDVKFDGTYLKQEVSTPEEMVVVPSNADMPQVEGFAPRKSRVEALKRLAQTSSRAKSTTVGKRRLMDDFIDQDDSDSDATEGSSSEDGEDENGRPRRERVKNSKVSIDVLRALYRAQNMHVKNQSAFVQKLERVLAKLPDDRTVVVLDNIESIMSSEDYEIDPSTGKTVGGDFLRLISRLSEYIAYHTKLTIVLVSSKPLPFDVSSRCVSVHLPAYSAETCRLIISRAHPELEPWFLNTAIALLYPVFAGNVALLRDTLLRVRQDEHVTSAVAGAEVAKTKYACSQEMKRLFGGGDETQNFEDTAKDMETVKDATKWLSRTEKQVLLAGYLAAYNPASQDKVLFRTVGQSNAPAGRKKVAASNAFRRGKLNADSIHVRAPVPFNLHRLLNIYRYVSGEWEEAANEDSGALFQRTVRELVQHGLFRSAASDDWLKTGVKLNCHAPHDLIELVASGVGLKLSEVLYG